MYSFNHKRAQNNFQVSVHTTLKPVCEPGPRSFIVFLCAACWTRQPGSWAAAVPPRAVRPQCVLSAAVSNSQLNLTAAPSLIHCSRWRRACRLCARAPAHFVWRGSCGTQGFARCRVQLRVQATQRRTIENEKLCSLKERSHSKGDACRQSPASLCVIRRGRGRFHQRVILEIISLHW